MKGLAAVLEDFSAPQTAVSDGIEAVPAAGEAMSEVELEGHRLEAFEKGYRAGWDDAIAAQSDDHTRISSAFGQHLQDLSFTYHEAYSRVMNAMTPLLEEMVRVVLPQTAHAVLGQHLVEQVQTLAREIGQLEVEIAVAPANVEPVAPLLEGQFGFPVRLVEDETLSDEQADIRFGTTEKQIDLGALLETVKDAVEGFTHENQRSVVNE
ncbi:ABC transporter ATP-binding protein [Cognatishimia sp. F0-27]|uniref:ABC transporter ATP-binding protein n=1 Tax=Cognatishimia sp. F0-27 TaxID=2816855 RepID=UPI001D0C046F|nr:ABC transporter ATP-binding protein [Cognatishimia sp. F0-27]MCC1491352.1 ABC transporter ATP-binding protein [Cognatishimia sp. F0-27]